MGFLRSPLHYQKAWSDKFGDPESRHVRYFSRNMDFYVGWRLVGMSMAGQRGVRGSPDRLSRRVVGFVGRRNWRFRPWDPERVWATGSGAF